MSQHGEPTCNNGVCVSISLCAGAPGAASARAVTTVVRIERSDDAIEIRPEDATASFRMQLRVAATTVSGTASGQFRDSNLVAVVAGTGQSPAAAAGTVLAASIAGKLDGQVSIDGYSCSNNGHRWTLVPR